MENTEETKHEIHTRDCDIPVPDNEYILIGTRPVDGDDPFIYSKTLVAPPFSFLDLTKRKPNPAMPPPTYLATSELAYKTLNDSKEVLAEFKHSSEGGLECGDPKICERQKGVMMDLIKQAFKAIFQKGGFVRISLPARVFEPRSTLDRIIDGWRTAPTYLPRAASLNSDPVSRMKCIIAFAVSGLYCMVTNLKPFNPLLGETLEAKFDDGSQIYCEHTSHHPAITNFLIKGASDLYTMHGRYIYKMNFATNSLEVRQSGYHHITFADGQTVSFKLPCAKIIGAVMGTRVMFYKGEMKFIDKVNALKAILIFDYGKTGGFFSFRKKGSMRDEFDGLIYKCNIEAKKQKKVAKLENLKDIESPICKVTGSWLKSLKFNGEEYWNIENVKLSTILYEPKVLPSDWRFREDLLWLRRENIPMADLWKKELEIQQRWDRAEREKYKKTKKGSK